MGLLTAVTLLAGGVVSAEGPEASPVPQVTRKDDRPSPSAAAGMKAAVDRQTGKLRHLTAEEEKELQQAAAEQARQAQSPAPTPQAVQHANGMTSLVLGAEYLEFMNAAVATINSDGTVSWTCVPGPGQVNEPANPSQQAPKLEEK